MATAKELKAGDIFMFGARQGKFTVDYIKELTTGDIEIWYTNHDKPFTYGMLTVLPEAEVEIFE